MLEYIEVDNQLSFTDSLERKSTAGSGTYKETRKESFLQDSMCNEIGKCEDCLK